MQLAACRCYMHGFHLVMGSIFPDSWAARLVSQAQRIVTFFRSSHIPLSKLYQEAHRIGITTLLVTPNKTRCTSVADMLASILKFKLPLQSVANGSVVKDSKVRRLVHNDRFWMDGKSISSILEPFSLVVVAIQAKDSLLADVFR